MAEPTILLLSTSDTDLISARSSGKDYRWANPARLSDEELPDLLADASIAVVRILGGYRAWQSGIDTVIASGVPTVLVSGEQAADADLMDRSTAPAGIALQTHLYLAHGGVDNLRQLHAFLSDTVLMTGYGFAPHGYEGSPIPFKKTSSYPPEETYPPSYEHTCRVTTPGGCVHIAGHGWDE